MGGACEVEPIRSEDRNLSRLETSDTPLNYRVGDALLSEDNTQIKSISCHSLQVMTKCH